MFSASEHHINYQYFLKNAANHYIGLAQTETVSGAFSHPPICMRLTSVSVQPYFQPNPNPPAPFIPNSAYDPTQLGPGDAWAFTVQNSNNILVFGASPAVLH